jgi:hypothetical protein
MFGQDESFHLFAALAARRRGRVPRSGLEKIPPCDIKGNYDEAILGWQVWAQ